MIDGQPWYVVAVTPQTSLPGEQPWPDLNITRELLEEVAREVLSLYDRKKIDPKAPGICRPSSSFVLVLIRLVTAAVQPTGLFCMLGRTAAIGAHLFHAFVSINAFMKV
jgi:hypothetical protein